MRYKYLIIFLFVLFFIELPLAYIYFSGQERAIEKSTKQIDLSETLFVSRDNPRYTSITMERAKIYEIVVSSTSKVNFSLTSQENFLEWLNDPDRIKPLEYFYQVDKVNFPFVPKDNKTYYFIFETDPLLSTSSSVKIEISSLYKEVSREDILDIIEPILQGTSVITVLLFIPSILPKGGLSRKKLEKSFFVLSDQAKSYNIAYLKEFKGFSEEEVNVLSIMSSKGRVTEKDIPELFDIPTFYKLYKMGFIEKVTEL